MTAPVTTGAPGAADLALAGLRRVYGDSVAVAGLDLAVAPGELLALLGPSGCGKTTTLRMVAGFVAPSAGTVRIAGRDVTRVPPHRRGTGMVFQSYALFPHLTVFENVAFGLRRRGVAAAEIARRVGEMLGLLRLDGLAERRPAQLSGGQQQRVAVGRALVIEPALLLLDEPFSNLDAQLRETTREELRRLQRQLGITTLFVTHDQAEALAMADRVAVMNAGRLEQVGPPAEVYARPASRFVGTFIGRSNVFEGAARAGRVETPDGLVLRAAGGAGPVALVRPESVVLVPGAASDAPPGENALAGRVETVAFQGATCLVEVAAGPRRLVAEAPARAAAGLVPGAAVTARWEPRDVILCGGVMREAMVIEGIEAPAGRLTTGRVTLGEYPDGPITAPVMVAHGARPGPTLFVQCLVHGPEVVGPISLARFLREIDLGALSGTVVGLLAANPLGLRAYNRLTPQDGANLNRVFPGKPDGSVSEQLAHRVMELATRHGDVLLDLHSGGDLTITAFYAIYPKLEGEGAREAARLAAATGSRYLWGSNEGWLKGAAFMAFARRTGRPALIVESGGGGRVTDGDLANFRTALHGVARAMGLLPGEPERAPDPCGGGNAIHLKATRGGFWQPLVEPGEEVVEAQEIGRVVDVFGEVVETVTCGFPRGWIGSIRRPWMGIHSGDQVIELVERIDP